MDLGTKLEVSILGGVFCNFGFGLREKIGSLDSGGGVFCNFGFGLKGKVGSLDSGGGGYSATSDCDLGEKVGSLDSGGVFCNFRFGLREKVGSLDSGGGILQLRIRT